METKFERRKNEAICGSFLMCSCCCRIATSLHIGCGGILQILLVGTDCFSFSPYNQEEKAEKMMQLQFSLLQIDLVFSILVCSKLMQLQLHCLNWTKFIHFIV
ncbi:hypothetical protein RchiOBHm_Chr5g0069991 [Rosa chinensis]|uniref:Uncharacterized protein n=1 Tax=Rosa chinensis TaxID=74649 RepID=A0A2P6QK39_ROSCH|nr:hypothetical protein RchiOBHm_Chr5g0069991 [Rosa chinensis]